MSIVNMVLWGRIPACVWIIGLATCGDKQVVTSAISPPKPKPKPKRKARGTEGCKYKAGGNVFDHESD